MFCISSQRNTHEQLACQLLVNYTGIYNLSFTTAQHLQLKGFSYQTSREIG